MMEPLRFDVIKINGFDVSLNTGVDDFGHKVTYVQEFYFDFLGPLYWLDYEIDTYEHIESVVRIGFENMLKYHTIEVVRAPLRNYAQIYGIPEFFDFPGAVTKTMGELPQSMNENALVPYTKWYNGWPELSRWNAYWRSGELSKYLWDQNYMTARGLKGGVEHYSYYHGLNLSYFILRG